MERTASEEFAVEVDAISNSFELSAQNFWAQNEALGSFLFSGLNEQLPVTETVQLALTPENYLTILSLHLDDYINDEPSISLLFHKFATHCNVEFSEPVTSEEELTHLAGRTETEISSFIENNLFVSNLGLLGEVEIAQLTEIYNPNNLLAFAKDLTSRFPDGLTNNQIDMIYRYKSIISRLDSIKKSIAESRAESHAVPKYGAKTWGGYIHPYGHEAGNIDPQEYQEFSESEDNASGKITMAGVVIKVSQVEKLG